MTVNSGQWVLLCAAAMMVAGNAPADSDRNGSFRKVFVSSATGTADLSTWADAGFFTGLDAADAVCQTRASAAGLANASNYIAWMSDSSDDAYCRLHGLTGKKANNCGLASLPESAGPWVRTDNWPFAEHIGLLLQPNRLVYTPPYYNENASPVPLSGLSPRVFTATDGNGELHPNSVTCGDWTDANAAGVVRGGDTTLTGTGWTGGSGTSCSAELRLMCMERVAGPELLPLGNTGNFVFVTSASGPGDLSAWPEAEPGTTGIAAGDSICSGLAADAGLDEPETYRAWLSDADTDAIDRLFTQGPWVRLDMVPVASSPAGLVSSTRFTAVSLTEQGDYLGNSGVWTGTADDGTAVGDQCSGWTDGTNSVTARTGSAYRSAAGWSSQFTHDCDSSFLRLYCFQDVSPDVLFLDGFEGGTPPL